MTPRRSKFVCRPRLRGPHGTTALEVMVSLLLLVTAMSIAAPLVVRHGRLAASARHYRLALDEIANQADRLAALDPTRLAAELENLLPSPFIAERLPSARLAGELTEAQFGRRLVLRLYWNEGERKTLPLMLATWLPPADDPAGDAAEEDTR